MSRYVVLRDLHGEHLPLGVAVERGSEVTIIALDEYGLPKAIREPYRVLQRDLSSVEYAPGQPGYFEQVLVELQRVASLGAVQEVDVVDRDALIELYNEKVVKPRLAAPHPYEVTTSDPEIAWRRSSIVVEDDVARDESLSDLRVAA